MTKNTRLELTWVGKENRPQLEPRILLEDPSLSYHAPHRVTETDQFDNLLIQGDNLLALKALEADYTGKVKCVYIDPPFNTGAAFDHYDDGVEHSEWLRLMRDRIELLRKLLRPDGCIFVHLDDNELDYLKVMMDEIFGRSNFVNRIAIEARSPSAFSTVNPGVFKSSEYILWYAKDRTRFVENRVRIKRAVDPAYSQFLINPEENPENWKFTTLKAAFEEKNVLPNSRRNTVREGLEQFVLDNAKHVFRFTAISETGAGQTTLSAKRQSEIEPTKVVVVERDGYDNQYIVRGQQLAFYEKNVAEIDGERVASAPLTNIWTDIAWEGIANEGGVTFKKGKKPEKLIKRCLELVTQFGDLVLDSFGGSGTTAAVAHKMRRRWIMIELGDHAITHIVPRIKRVIDGTDLSGISKVMHWAGGGGFRFYTLAPSLLTKDRWDNWVINKEYNAAMLAEALCKLHGFRYAPNPEVYWQQGHSTETDYLYVTTATLTHAQLQQLADEVGAERTLLVLCPAFKGKADGFANLTVKKIPRHVLHRCEWGHDDYSLRVENLPQAPAKPGQQVLAL